MLSPLTGYLSEFGNFQALIAATSRLRRALMHSVWFCQRHSAVLITIQLPHATLSGKGVLTK